MKIECGAEALDKNGEFVGTVSNVIRNTWTGKIIKFMVRTESPEAAYLFSPEQVLEVTNSKIKLNISREELNESA